MSEPRKVIYPPGGPDTYRIPFGDSFSRKPLHEQQEAVREIVAALPDQNGAAADG